jgi:NADH:ubiquinone reductase (H+-translocating)
MSNNPVHIVIIGGGFGGVACALELFGTRDTFITVISDNANHVYYPGMYRILSGKSTDLVNLPLSEILNPEIETIIAKVTAIDANSKRITLDNGQQITPDILVLSPGMETSFFNITGADQTTQPFRSVDDAVNLRKRVSSLFQQHCKCSPEEQIIAFRFLVVGAGPSGCEIAGTLAKYARQCATECGVSESMVTVDLLEGRDRVLPLLTPKASQIALSRLRSLGVNVYLNRKLVESRSWSAMLSDSTLGTKTVIWSAGLVPNHLVSKIADFQYNQKGKISVDENCQVINNPGIYCIGDVAGTPVSGLAQTAIYDGKFVAKNIKRQILEKKLVKYVTPKIFTVVPIGESWAVAEFAGIVISGHFANLLRTLADINYYDSILKLPATLKRIRQLMNL